MSSRVSPPLGRAKRRIRGSNARATLVSLTTRSASRANQRVGVIGRTDATPTVARPTTHSAGNTGRHGARGRRGTRPGASSVPVARAATLSRLERHGRPSGRGDRCWDEIAVTRLNAKRGSAGKAWRGCAPVGRVDRPADALADPVTQVHRLSRPVDRACAHGSCAACPGADRVVWRPRSGCPGTR